VAISDPVAVYNAKNDIDAHLVCEYLQNHGIESHVTRDDSLVGTWRLLPEIQKPQVWIDRSAVEAAKPLLMKYEQRQRLHATPAEGSAERERDYIEVVCEECGKTSVFGGSKNGTVQDCQHCGAYVDVSDDPILDDFDTEPPSESHD
jgi:hypothetical protein